MLATERFFVVQPTPSMRGYSSLMGFNRPSINSFLCIGKPTSLPAQVREVPEEEENQEGSGVLDMIGDLNQKGRGLGRARLEMLLPGDRLKLKALKQLKKQSGKGVSLPGSGLGRLPISGGSRVVPRGLLGAGLLSGVRDKILTRMATVLSKIMFPKLEEELRKAFNQKLQSGSGLEELNKLVKMSIDKVLPANKKISPNMLRKQLKPIASKVSKVFMPVLQARLKHSVPSRGEVHETLKNEIKNGLKEIMEIESRGMKGSGIFGKSKRWWKNFGKGFAKGFKSVAKPGLKIVGALATATGQPEIGIPATIISEAL